MSLYNQDELIALQEKGYTDEFKGSSWDDVFCELASAAAEPVEGRCETDGTYPARQLNAMASTTHMSVNLKELKRYLREHSSLELEKRHGLSKARLRYMLNQGINLAATRQVLAEYDRNGDGTIDRGEWLLFLNNNKDFMGTSLGGEALRVIAYAPVYNCKPPTLFILLITISQIVLFLISVYSPESLGISHAYGTRLWPLDSSLVYSPYRRYEAWRFVSYMFLHGNVEHITFNCIMQVLVGLPIEMSQMGWIGSIRVALLYLAGVGLGGLGASCAQPNKFLLGASAGVYALIAAHLATLILNWNEDGIVWNTRNERKHNSDGRTNPGLNPIIRGFRLAFIILFTLLDVGQALYRSFVLGEESSVSYAGHGFGALAGLLIGVFLLENRKVEDWETKLKWVAFGLYFLALATFVVWEVVGNSWFPTSCKEDPEQAICNI